MSVDVERSEGGGAGCALLLQVCLFFLLRFVGLLSWKTDTGGKHSNTEELNQKLTRSNRTDAFADPDAVVVLTFIPLSVSPRISIRLSLRGTPRRLPPLPPPPSYDHDDDVLVISQMPLMEHKGASDSERRLILKMVCVAAGSSRLSSLGAQPCIAPY